MIFVVVRLLSTPVYASHYTTRTWRIYVSTYRSSVKLHSSSWSISNPNLLISRLFNFQKHHKH